MAEHTFKLEVVTPDRVVLSDDKIVSVTAPGAEGYFGVLANHAPMMAQLKIGQLDFRKEDGGADAMAISGGFIEIFENSVTVLAESAELATEIDVERAEQAKTRAEQRLSAPPPDVDFERAQVALQRAINRLRVAGR